MNYFNDESYSLGILAFNSQALSNKEQFTYDADGDVLTYQKLDYNNIVVLEVTFEYYPADTVTTENPSGKKKLKSTTTTQLNRQ